MQKFVSQPSDRLDGIYKVARWNEINFKYEELPIPYLCEYDAVLAAGQFNEEYEEEQAREYERVHQNELIDKYYGFANSTDIHKRNAAREFFSRFPYQRDVCEKLLRDMGDE